MKKKNVNRKGLKEVLNTLSPQEAKNVRGGANEAQQALNIKIGIRITF